MKENRNAYEIIGTSREAVSRIKKEQDKNMFIMQKSQDTKRRILRRKTELEERLHYTEDAQQKLDIHHEIYRLESEMSLIEKAYQEIYTEERRNAYDASLNAMFQSIRDEIREERRTTNNAYKILYTSRDRCDDRLQSPLKIDTQLRDMRNGLIKNHQERIELLENEINVAKNNVGNKKFREITRLEGEIAMLKKQIERIKDAYAKVETREKRQEYEAELKEIERQEKERNRQSCLRKKYKKSQYYDPNLIVQLGYKELEPSEGKKLKQEIGKRKNSSAIRLLKRADGTEVTVEKIGMLAYKNAFNKTGMLDEYRITRIIDGEKKWDVRYTNLNMIDLSQNRETEEPRDKDYYDFVTNVFLSEDSIEGAKYNGGYLGEVLKDRDGNYVHDLGDINELSATIKFNEIKKEKEKIAESKKGETHEQ